MKIALQLSAEQREACLDCAHGLNDNEQDKSCDEGHGASVAQRLIQALDGLAQTGGELTVDCEAFGMLEYTLEVWGEQKDAACALLARLRSAPDVRV